MNLPPALEQIERATIEANFSMPSDRETGSLLRTLCSAKPGGRFLEIGTGTGLSACWMLSGMSADSSLLSIDNDETVSAIAQHHLSDPKIEFAIGDGLLVLQSLENNSFDLIFADAMPGKYESFDLTVCLLRTGGFCVLDDMLPQSNWPEGHQARVDELMRTIVADTRLTATFLQYSTGLVLCTKVSN